MGDEIVIRPVWQERREREKRRRSMAAKKAAETRRRNRERARILGAGEQDRGGLDHLRRLLGGFFS